MHSRPASDHRTTPRFASLSGAGRACALGIGLLLAFSASDAFAADETVAVSETVDLAASPARTWRAIKDFDRWQSWHPAFAGTSIVKGASNRTGEVRVLAAKDGAKFTEELVSHDSTTRSYEYRILESPLPIANYVSKLEVQARHPGSHVIWSSTFQVKAGASEAEVKKMISGVYRTGLNNLAAVVSAPTSTY